MTAVKVVDASALLFGEPEAETVASALDGVQLVAPSLLAFELTNVCLMKCRRHPDQRDALVAGFQMRDRLGIEEIAVDHSDALKLALKSGLTAYDASYLWLARQLGRSLSPSTRRLGALQWPNERWWLMLLFRLPCLPSAQNAADGLINVRSHT